MKKDPKEIKGKIVDHRRVTPEYYVLKIQAPEIALSARPGQFIMVRLDDLHDPLLRRPFSFSRILPSKKKPGGGLAEGGFEVCYQVVGRGTARMTRLRKGERVDILGPLGRGFWREEGVERQLLIGGGIGIAPLLPWAEELAGKKGSAKGGAKEIRVEILLGGKNSDRVLGVREIKKLGLEPQIATEDGSLGLPGMVTDLLERELLSKSHKSTAIYACGPMPMLARVAQVAEQFDVPCQVLLESRMACGVGACLGCAVKIRAEGKDQMEPTSAPQGGLCGSEEEPEKSLREEMAVRISGAPFFRYGRVCKEGPVFRAQEILWE
ncbi:MAG: pyrK [Deltaproteobacteria bacterium]|nr:pyrK [Deltaproteobacteria bacterium]